MPNDFDESLGGFRVYEDPFVVALRNFGEQLTREKAYQLWEKAGRPEGRSDEFWLEAEKILYSPLTNIPFMPDIPGVGYYYAPYIPNVPAWPQPDPYPNPNMPYPNPPIWPENPAWPNPNLPYIPQPNRYEITWKGSLK
jgi:hypothetical protein